MRNGAGGLVGHRLWRLPMPRSAGASAVFCCCPLVWSRRCWLRNASTSSSWRRLWFRRAEAWAALVRAGSWETGRSRSASRSSVTCACAAGERGGPCRRHRCASLAAGWAEDVPDSAAPASRRVAVVINAAAVPIATAPPRHTARCVAAKPSSAHGGQTALRVDPQGMVRSSTAPVTRSVTRRSNGRTHTPCSAAYSRAVSVQTSGRSSAPVLHPKSHGTHDGMRPRRSTAHAVRSR